MSVFGSRLRKLMEDNEIEGKELAKFLKVAQPTVSNWVNGKRSPSQEMLVVLADFFRVSSDYLLGRTDDPTSDNPRDPDDLTLWLSKIDGYSELTPENKEMIDSVVKSMIEKMKKK